MSTIHTQKYTNALKIFSLCALITGYNTVMPMGQLSQFLISATRYVGVPVGTTMAFGSNLKTLFDHGNIAAAFAGNNPLNTVMPMGLLASGGLSLLLGVLPHVGDDAFELVTNRERTIKNLNLNKPSLGIQCVLLVLNTYIICINKDSKLSKAGWFGASILHMLCINYKSLINIKKYFQN
ncbi:hypothetical protein EKK58_01900 [Candidatus Dependentiae bacterium]|nr:MAG: hypothetical protein EKK58_01900 [Candidatus Dependentiae bacterium]